MPHSEPSFWNRLRERARATGRWLGPALRSRSFWLGIGLVVGGLAGFYLLFNHAVMPFYTRQNIEVTVPEVRELPYEQAVRLIEGRRLRAERRDHPFNPAFPREVILDQNPAPNASVKPGRRIYLYVNSGTERTVAMPEVRTLTESVARSELSELGLTQVETRTDETPSPYPGTVTRQEPVAGASIRTSDQVVLWISRGMGEGTIDVPDVRGMSHERAVEVLTEAGLWVDPTREVSGTITRQEPGAGTIVRTGAEIRLSSAPIEEEPPAFPPDEFEEGIPRDDAMPGVTPAPPPDDDPRDADRTDW